MYFKYYPEIVLLEDEKTHVCMEVKTFKPNENNKVFCNLFLPPAQQQLHPSPSTCLLSICIIQDATAVVYSYVRFMSSLEPSSVCACLLVCKRPDFKTDSSGCWLLK